MNFRTGTQIIQTLKQPPLEAARIRLRRCTRIYSIQVHRAMSSVDFPPSAVKEVVQEVAALLKERKETISVAETVCVLESANWVYILQISTGCRWHHLRIAALGSRRQHLLQRRSYGMSIVQISGQSCHELNESTALYTRFSPRLRWLDAGHHPDVSRPNTSNRQRPRHERTPDPRLYIHSLRVGYRGTWRRGNKEQDTGLCGIGCCQR